MKRVTTSLLFAILVIGSTTAVTLAADLRATKLDRKLSTASLIDSQISREVQKISIEKIREEIIDLHKNVKICIDEEFAKEPADILPFDEILRTCAGDNFAIIIRFYADVNFAIKEIIKERIKGELKNGFCDNILFMCIEYFKILESFMEKDYDIIKAIELNRPELEKKIDEDKLNYMVRLTEREVGDYNTVRQDLLDERRFLTEYFSEQFNAYKEKYGAPSHVRDDTLIGEDHAENPSDGLLDHYDGSSNDPSEGESEFRK